MTTEQKAEALVNEVIDEREYTYKHTSINRVSDMAEALCRAIEQHEAFRQEVSDAVELSIDRSGHDGLRAGHINEYLGRFIIPAPKPDPLVAALEGVTFDHYPPNDAKTIRAALDALGFEIREKGQ